MSFVLSKVLWPLATPSNLLALLMVVGAVLLLTRWRRAGRRLLVGVGLGVALLMALPVDSWLAMPLEARFPVASELPEAVDGVVVLGGGVYRPPMEELAGAQLNSAADRIAALVVLGQRYPAARLIYTGGDSSLFGDVREADLVEALLRRMGFDVGRVQFERNSRNTHENAVNTMALAAPKPDETWLLVTSAIHMPRAVGVFRAAGWNAIPVPVDIRNKQEFGLLDLGPSLSGRLSGIDLALHEWAGLVAYRVLGYSDSLFPGAEP
ncbi:MAG: membrane protein [Alphaproteobacteria bacterium]|nr:MAG: membrane protein [Alphaproteobacteria bacterium]